MHSLVVRLDDPGTEGDAVTQGEPGSSSRKDGPPGHGLRESSDLRLAQVQQVPVPGRAEFGKTTTFAPLLHRPRGQPANFLEVRRLVEGDRFHLNARDSDRIHETGSFLKDGGVCRRIHSAACSGAPGGGRVAFRLGDDMEVDETRGVPSATTRR